VPGAGNARAYDRYAYSANNPILYSDLSDHAFEAGVYAGESAAGIGPLIPTYVFDQNGITLSKLAQEQMDYLEEAGLNAVVTMLENLLTGVQQSKDMGDRLLRTLSYVNYKHKIFKFSFQTPGYPGAPGYKVNWKFNGIQNNDSPFTLSDSSIKVGSLTVQTDGFKVTTYESKYRSLASSMKMGASFVDSLVAGRVNATFVSTYELTGNWKMSSETSIEASGDKGDAYGAGAVVGVAVAVFG